MEVNESPVFLRLDPSKDAAQKDLPVYLYESGGSVALFLHCLGLDVASAVEECLQTGRPAGVPV